MAIGASASAANGMKSLADNSPRLASTTGMLKWLSTMARPWPGHVLDHRQHAAVREPFHHRPAELGDSLGVGRKGPIADNVMAPFHRHIQNRDAINIDAKRCQVKGMQIDREARRHAGRRSHRPGRCRR